ncbi:MAG TPA: 2-amino-4-hydroxy-6-hydroxymethyldihydropteridine diphosphokinase [Rectinemataceae bacterium]|nr:2-amino-4-hydroxy-6-hydroxymethyldihydropteridine diphosphokinase [Rectinemataceae bacterium]
MALVFLGLGSNVGDSVATIKAAFAELAGELRNPKFSRLWRSRPRYMEDQPDFVNAAIAGETDLEPRALLGMIQGIEAAHGRDRSREQFKGPRPLDVDILLYGDRLIAEPDLLIPHPGLRERKFALLPLLDIAPRLVDPATGVRFSAIAASLPAQGIYLLGGDGYDYALA